MDTVNYVARLNELSQKQRWEINYEVVGSTGLDHIKTFTVRAVVNGQPYANGEGTNKKNARQIAAKNALESLQDSSPEPIGTPQSNVPASPVHPSGITQCNYVCWLNEYGQKNGLSIRAEESMTPGACTTASQCCRFVVGDKEYPPAYGSTKKEAKEEAAKLVHFEIFGSKKTETGESLSDQSKEEVAQSVSVSRESSLSRSFTTEDEGFADTNFIGILNHYCQKKGLLHDYVLEKKDGPPHDPKFFYRVRIGNEDYPSAKGKNSKDAKQKAARLAWSALQEQSDWDSKVSDRSSDGLPGRMNTPPLPKMDATPNRQVQRESAPAPSPEGKHKIKLAANFNNCRNSKEYLMPDMGVEQCANPVATPAPPPVHPRFLTDYESIEPLGKGGFGRVFKAQEKLIKKYYAIKIISYKEKALHEVRALSDLSHDNIVRYYTCWVEDKDYQWDASGDSSSSSKSTGDASGKFLYIQMELCDTKTLGVWIDEKNVQNVKKSRRDSQRREESLKIAQQLISGVTYIHSKSFIHRDLKPSNVLFGRDSQVKIGDFGLVTSESKDGESVVERSSCKGTLSYMAPEQIWDDLRAQTFPEDFTHQFFKESLIIKSMLTFKPEDRPEAPNVKKQLEGFDELSYKHTC